MQGDYPVYRKRIIFNNAINRADRFIYHHLSGGNSLRNRFFMQSLPSLERTQKYFIEKMESNRPFSGIRFGLYEYQLCYQFLEKKAGIRKNYSKYIKEHISIDAGMDDDDSNMDWYAEKIILGLKNVDAVGCWRNYPERLVFSDYLNDPYYFDVNDLYPFPFFHLDRRIPYWQQCLSQKKVLIVTSFASTIEKQYSRREHLWDDRKILPDFFLSTYQAPVTNGICTIRNWKSHYEELLSDLLTFDFDIVLISAGSYGLPLSIDLKLAGKKAIQWGGCYQLWFGILGKRWDSDTEVNKYKNHYWTYPDRKETPSGAFLVDGGSYWKE